MSYDVFDKVQVRCPQLGGEVTFGYCRSLNEGLPCPRSLVCFELKFPVEVYFRKVLEEETFDRIFSTPPPSRMERFLTTLAQAKQRVEESSK
jgi:hypothetical protein